MHGYSFTTSNSSFINVPGSSQQRCWLDPGTSTGVSATTRELTPNAPSSTAKRPKIEAICDMHMGDLVFDNKLTHIGAMQRDNLIALLNAVETLSFGGTSLNALVDKGKKGNPERETVTNHNLRSWLRTTLRNHRR